VDFFPTFDGADGDALPSPWLDQKSPDLDLAQNRSLPVEMDRSVVAMDFQESLSQPFADIEDQSTDQDQEISEELADLPSPSMDVDGSEIPTTTSENALQAEKASGQKGTRLPSDPSLIDGATPNLADSQSKNQHGQADEEHLAAVGSCTDVEQKGVGMPEKDLQACLSDDSSSATGSEERGAKDSDSQSCQSLKSDVEPSPSTDDPADDDEEEEDPDSATSMVKSSIFESVDLDDETALQFLKRLKAEGKLDKLFKKVNHLATNKAGLTPVVVRSDNYPCPRCTKTFNRKCELK
jgi:hypothetical protein